MSPKATKIIVDAYTTRTIKTLSEAAVKQKRGVIIVTDDVRDRMSIIARELSKEYGDVVVLVWRSIYETLESKKSEMDPYHYTYCVHQCTEFLSPVVLMVFGVKRLTSRRRIYT